MSPSRVPMRFPVRLPAAICVLSLAAVVSGCAERRAGPYELTGGSAAATIGHGPGRIAATASGAAGLAGASLSSEGISSPSHAGPAHAGVCRAFTHAVVAHGHSARVRGTACRQPDGSWQVTG